MKLDNMQCLIADISNEKRKLLIAWIAGEIENDDIKRDIHNMSYAKVKLMAARLLLKQ